MRNAFTIVELIIVIVILGILSAIAIPKFTDTVEDAYISQAQQKVSTIRSGLSNYRSKHLMMGDWNGTYPALAVSGNINSLIDTNVTIGNNAGEWSINAAGTQFTFHTGEHDIVFNYNPATGDFSCVSPNDICNRF